MSETTKNTTSLKIQSAWLLFAKVLGFVFAFLFPLLVVRFLSQAEVGIYRQAFLVITNVAVIIPLGVSMSAYYFLARESSRRASAVFNILIFNFAVGALAFLTFFFYPQILGSVFQDEEITRLAPMIGLVVWLWVFSSFLETVAVANQEPKLAASFILLSQFTKTTFMLCAVIFYATVESFIYAAIIQTALQSVVLLVYLKSRFAGFWTSFDPNFFREQLVYALPFGFAGLLWTLQTDIHNYFVGYRFSAQEFAIYAYGCFQLPLITMLSESINSVLIPQMSRLQAENDKQEMIRLTIRAMQKLAFFYFPIYAFLMITAQTFIITLFTRSYEASASIFIINLTLLPFYIWITDPIVRAYRELGRFLLVWRIIIFAGLTSALYFGIQHFDLRGMIAIVVVITLLEKFITTIVVWRKLDFSLSSLSLFSDIGKTAVCTILASIFTFLFYTQFGEKIAAAGAAFAEKSLSSAKPGLVDFVSGGLVLGLCFLIFTPVYLLSMNFFGLIDEEKDFIKTLLKRIFRRVGPENPVGDITIS